MLDLSKMKHTRCLPCTGETEALQKAQIVGLLAQLAEEWQEEEGKPVISRTFRFGNYYQTMAFVNAVAFIAHREDHHPDLEVGYNRCKVSFTTHAIKGLSENDFICAAKVDDLEHA